MSSYHIQQEHHVAQVIDMVRPLLEAHRDELVTRPDLMVLDPDVDTYVALEAADMLILLVAYNGHTVVGYSCTVVVPKHLHYRGLRYAENDVLYVAPEYRSSRLGAQLMARTREAARLRGAQFIMWHAKPATTLDTYLRKHAGLQDHLYGEVL